MSCLTELSLKFLYNVEASSETYFLFHFNIILSSNIHNGCLGQLQTAKTDPTSQSRLHICAF